MSKMPAKQTEDDQWHEQITANPATQEMAEIYLSLFETKKSRCLFGSEYKKVFPAGL